MKADNFCYWLQGYFELGATKELTTEQVEMIKRHLAMVFYTDLDNQFPKEQQVKLQTLHDGHKVDAKENMQIRC